ncbi:hypothetical protein BLNAU_14106 [Blattamonas nauphoetae]|uniref:Uncharacterized protein n=1 Tax=Blattamonas nauphoetae TaxID=2049346 RepID=A0ABQ9XEL7_9EUKA|nr:hypothetical protein BLNAU_14106 [Blattamonas nauphoetae]
MNFNPSSEMSFEDKSRFYYSLVALVKGKYPFDNALQDKAALILSCLEPKWYERDYAAQLVTNLVPSSAGSPSGFLESILTLSSSPHSSMVSAALSFLYETARHSSTEILLHFVESDLISNLLTIVQPNTLPISENETIFDYLVRLVNSSLHLALPSSLEEITITTAVDTFNHREMIFQKVVIPSSPFLTFLISNRHIFKKDLFESFMDVLDKFIQIGPFHRPTLEFVLASPIVMAFSRCFSVVESCLQRWTPLSNIQLSLTEWKKHGPEVVRSGRRMIRALISDDFEDTIEQMLMHTKDTSIRKALVEDSRKLVRFMGANIRRQ